MNRLLLDGTSSLWTNTGAEFCINQLVLDKDILSFSFHDFPWSNRMLGLMNIIFNRSSNSRGLAGWCGLYVQTVHFDMVSLLND